MTTTKSTGTLHFLFEADASHGWVNVLADTKLVKGYIASQNAGSINACNPAQPEYCLYYQVGGSGVNGHFADPLRVAHQLQDVNDRLKSAYDDIYGQGEWAKDSRAGREDRLTSTLIEIDPGKGTIGAKVCGMMYSVGPILDEDGITDEAQYRQIYGDALLAIAQWNDAADAATGFFPIGALRITMLSCGIYAGSVTDMVALVTTSARGIIQGLCAAAQDPACKSAADTVILLNVNDKDLVPGDKRKFKERWAFTQAAQALGLTVTATGFSADY